MKQSWLESGTVYGYRKVTDDLREQGEACGKHRVARLMRSEGLKAQVGYGRRRNHHGGKPSTVAPNHLDRQFEPLICTSVVTVMYDSKVSTEWRAIHLAQIPQFTPRPCGSV